MKKFNKGTELLQSLQMGENKPQQANGTKFARDMDSKWDDNKADGVKDYKTKKWDKKVEVTYADQPD